MSRKWFIPLLALIIALYFASTVFFRLSSDNTPTEPESPSNSDVVPRIDPFDGWLEQLAKNEDCPLEGIIDTNGLRSYGPFCYQEGTWIIFAKKFNAFPGVEDKELLNLIGDHNAQWKVTRLVFWDSYENWRHWRTTVLKKIGMPPKE